MVPFLETVAQLLVMQWLIIEETTTPGDQGVQE